MTNEVDFDRIFDVDVKALNEELSTGNTLYLSKQPEKVVLRIVWEYGKDDKYFQEYYTDFNGKPVQQFVFKAVRVVGKEKTPVYVVGKQTHIKEINRIIGALKEDNDIKVMHPRSGTCLSFTKTGEGLSTRYNVSPTLKVVDIMEQYTNGFDMTLQEFVDKQTQPKEPKEQNFDIDEKELFDE